MTLRPFAEYHVYWAIKNKKEDHNMIAKRKETRKIIAKYGRTAK